MDLLVKSLGKWAVNTEFSVEAGADLDWRADNIEVLMNKYKIDENSKDNQEIKGDDLKELVTFSKTYERFMLNKPI